MKFNMKTQIPSPATEDSSSDASHTDNDGIRSHLSREEGGNTLNIYDSTVDGLAHGHDLEKN